MAIATTLTRLLEIAHPILLAPMGGVAGGALAAAVSHLAKDQLPQLGNRDARTTRALLKLLSAPRRRRL